MTKPTTGFRYAQQFKCSGADCPETCCFGWRINVPQGEYATLHGHYGDTHRGNPCFEVMNYPEGTPQVVKDEGFAFLKMKGDGFCPFLEDGWCAIHRDLGEAFLPGVCATYPRYMVEGGAGDFLSGSLSCPEMARLCLLSEDGMVPVGIERDQLPPGLETSTQEPGKENWYQYFFPAVNGYLKWLLAQKELRAADFALLALDLAAEIQPFYHAGITENPAEQLDACVGRHADPNRIVPRVSAFRARNEISGAAMAFVGGMLLKGVKQQRSPRFRVIAQETMDRLPNLEVFYAARVPFVPLQLGHLTDLLLERREKVQARFGERLTEMLGRFTLNFWTQKLYSDEAGLLRLWLKYALYYACLRFLSFNHPRFEAAATVADEAEAQAACDLAFVDMVQGFMRAFDHDTPLVGQILDQFPEQGLTTLLDLEGLLLY
ncbi:flagellin lysine-N-methylase [Acanthopleuribacter pedis]|uniref:Flagellin lysine-N-methylase n=1 Tax=Acanthopleuribacter pedis TaxID=442870 RepID=A0A8J7QAB7_9BACT|nr:flagellin lysine-N-methylase [Acanthopleuribacter pedis]MBO1321721.1 flagellin lysine-N-methylase [Acanthopleuribacter pedis]